MNGSHYIPSTFPYSNVVHSFWQTEDRPAFQTEHIMPKGVVEIIFSFSNNTSLTASIGNKTYHTSRCFINGFNIAPISLQLPAQQVFFGIGLQPMAVKKFLKIPACEFADAIVDVELVDHGFHSLWHELAEQTSFENRVAVFYRFIEKQLFSWQPQEQLVNDFLCGTGQHDLSVPQLAGSLCYSTRQLSRKISEATGMNTEEMLLYKRYLHALHLIHHTDLSLTAIAYQSHFSDQSHFIKSFRAYTNMTPGEYRNQKSFLEGHLYRDVR